MTWRGLFLWTGRSIAAAAAILGLASIQPVAAQDANTVPVNEVGLADACSSCHGVSGVSRGSIPSLAGRDHAALVSMLRAFRSQQGDATIMNRIARGYTDAEFEALADYFSTVKSK